VQQLSTGEFYVLSHVERQCLYQVTDEQVRHRVPVLAGTSVIPLSDVVTLGQPAAGYGMDGIWTFARALPD
jgi:dihydrodipicolinate synthase/N-acetylneuraminate lyase